MQAVSATELSKDRTPHVKGILGAIEERVAACAGNATGDGNPPKLLVVVDQIDLLLAIHGDNTPPTSILQWLMRLQQVHDKDCYASAYGRHPQPVAPMDRIFIYFINSLALHSLTRC